MSLESSDMLDHQVAAQNIGVDCIISPEQTVSSLATIGRECKIHDDVYIDNEVIIGSFCKIQRGVYIFAGTVLEDGVFIGPERLY